MGRAFTLPVTYLTYKKIIDWTLNFQPLLKFILDVSRFWLQFSSTTISARVNLILFVALFVSFPLVPHVLGIQIDLLDPLISQSWLIIFTLVLSKGSLAPQANERTREAF